MRLHDITMLALQSSKREADTELGALPDPAPLHDVRRELLHRPVHGIGLSAREDDLLGRANR